MAKQAKNTVETSTGSILPLMRLFSPDKNIQQQLMDLITKEGPPHKQWQHTLVLSKIQKLLISSSKKNNKKLASLNRQTSEEEFPIFFPKKMQTEKNKQVMKELVKGPEHEVAYTLILLQCIEWLAELEK